MSYINAEDVLPKNLIDEIQKYIDGQLMYIPRKNEKRIQGIIHEYESSKKDGGFTSE